MPPGMKHVANTPSETIHWGILDPGAYSPGHAGCSSTTISIFRSNMSKVELSVASLQWGHFSASHCLRHNPKSVDLISTWTKSGLKAQHATKGQDYLLESQKRSNVLMTQGESQRQS